MSLFIRCTAFAGTRGSAIPAYSWSFIRVSPARHHVGECMDSTGMAYVGPWISCGDILNGRFTTNSSGNELKVATRPLTVPVDVVAGGAGASDSVLWVLEPLGVFKFRRGRSESLDTSRKGGRGFEDVIRKGPPFPVVHGDRTESFNKVWLASASGCERDKRSGVVVPYVGPRVVVRQVATVGGEDGAITVPVFGEPEFSTDIAQE